MDAWRSVFPPDLAADPIAAGGSMAITSLGKDRARSAADID
jgi:hypothetical protein